MTNPDADEGWHGHFKLGASHTGNSQLSFKKIRLLFRTLLIFVRQKV